MVKRLPITHSILEHRIQVGIFDSTNTLNSQLLRKKIMTKIGFMLLLLILASCGSNDGTNTAGSPASGAGATSVLQFQSGSEELKLASLQVDKNVYPDVTLRLAQDNTWQLKSFGAMRPLALGESAQAVLTAPVGTTLDMNWRPADATIMIRRMHIDAKVFGSVPLRLVGDKWSWGNDFQAGNDLQDLHELKALTLADYQANPALAATDAHHTVLQSAPGSGTQSFPLQLSAKTYKFCMDKQDEGADSITLLDPAGAAVVSLKAGDACASIKLAAGLYTMQHVYGGQGKSRTVFIRPDAAAAAAAQPAASTASRKNALSASAPRKGILAASDPNYPEYAAIHLLANSAHGDGYLSLNGFMGSAQLAKNLSNWWGAMTQFTAGCVGDVDAAASLATFTRPGDPNSHYLLDSRNFFQIIRDANGTPTDLFPPLFCKSTPGASFYGPNGLFQIAPVDSTQSDVFNDQPIIYNSPGPNQFQLGAGWKWGDWNPTTQSHPKIYTSYFGFQGTSANLVSPGLSSDSDVSNQWLIPDGYGGYNVVSQITGILYDNAYMPNGQGQDAYEIAYRYFPNGLPPSMQDSSGSWLLNSGEVAVFANADCSGAALITNVSLPQQSGITDVQRVYNSLWLGPNTVSTVTDVYSTSGTLYNQSGCPKLINPLDVLYRSLNNIGVSTTINIQTNGCPYCNLAGLTLNTFTLKGANLAHANLTGVILNGMDLTGINLSNAYLQGANLSNANLESANMAGALFSLQNGVSGNAAQLTGAHLKNANLSGAHLDSANFTDASFYSSNPGPCTWSAASVASPTSACATANGATMSSGTLFTGAYLAGVDMGNIKGTGVNFTSAILIGASFNSANLSSTNTGVATSFANAYLQGADFTGATFKGANFDNAYIETDSSNDCRQVQLTGVYTDFPGFMDPKTVGSAHCADVPATTLRRTPTCVAVTIAAGTAYPATDSSNICPDGSTPTGSCSANTWKSPSNALVNATPKTSSCINTAASGVPDSRVCAATNVNACWVYIKPNT